MGGVVAVNKFGEFDLFFTDDIFANNRVDTFYFFFVLLFRNSYDYSIYFFIPQWSCDEIADFQTFLTTVGEGLRGVREDDVGEDHWWILAMFNVQCAMCNVQ